MKRALVAMLRRLLLGRDEEGEGRGVDRPLRQSVMILGVAIGVAIILAIAVVGIVDQVRDFEDAMRLTP